jgi:hypothetical protein
MRQLLPATAEVDLSVLDDRPTGRRQPIGHG